MTCSIELSSACLPVTALCFVLIDHESLLLAGQGSFLTIRSHGGGNLLRRRIFKSEAIHGIVLDVPTRAQVSLSEIRLLLYGNSQACLAQLNLEHDETAEDLAVVSFSTGPVYNVGNWILFGSIFHGDSTSKANVCFISAHNELRGLFGNNEDDTNELKSSVKLMAKGPSSILYSAHLKPISAAHIIVAAGTVFGEIHIWSCHMSSCDSWVCTVHYTLTGHLGSVFGVCISDEVVEENGRKRVLASCSDDRTIRIWDISECNFRTELITSGASKDVSLARGTGFGNSVIESCASELAVAWGHLSRIWGVEFIHLSGVYEANQIRLVSRGEDAVCQFWELTLSCVDASGVSGRLHPLQSDRNHSGKNVWSMTTGNEKIFTGGADGGIVSRPCAYSEASKCFEMRASFLDVISKCGIANALQTGPNPIPRTLKQYLFLGPQILLATTEYGQLLRGTLEFDQSEITWDLLYTSTTKSTLQLSHNAVGNVGFMADQNIIMTILSPNTARSRILSLNGINTPQVTWMYVAWANYTAGCAYGEVCLVSTIRASSKMRVIFVTIEKDSTRYQEIEIDLPETFAPKTACYNPEKHLLLLGSRLGAVAVYQNVESMTERVLAPLCLRRVHGIDAVTSIIALSSTSGSIEGAPQQSFFLTTGRDGAYAVHRIRQTGDSALQLDDFLTVHESSAPFGSNIEGAHIVGCSKPSTHDELFLYGFRSKDFVVWNDTAQTEVFSVTCGGSHRSWSYHPQRQMSKNPDGSSGGSFVWTKTGFIHFYSRSHSQQHSIQEGGHGREIKAMAKCPISYSDPGRGIKESILVATGAEDTTIRIFAVPPQQDSINRFRCIRVLKRHTTGLQHLQFSECGRFLFSSAGCEEFFVWRLRLNVPSVGIGAVLQDSLPKDEADSDARITSFDARDKSITESDAERRIFLIAAAYSNGKVKTFWYHPGAVRSGRFEILNEILEGQFCLTQLHLTENPSEFVEVFTSGTNGYLNARSIQLSNPLAYETLLRKVRIHQSSVKALHVVKLTDRLTFIATGGDDNALGLTLAMNTNILEERDDQMFRSILIPRAHAAGITALVVLGVNHRSSTAELIMASSGNDQKVIVWRAVVAKDVASGEDSRREGLINPEEMQVEKIGEAWTNVADVGGMEVLRLENDIASAVSRCELLVVGVGMEMMKLEF